ncbi:hypothetical protein Tco_1568752 [Tanacetum coccineum]
MGILYKSMEVQNKLGSNNLVLVLKQESMEYMMKNVVCGIEVELQKGAQRDREAEFSLPPVIKGLLQQCTRESSPNILGAARLKQSRMGWLRRTNGDTLGLSSAALPFPAAGVEFEVEPQEDHTFEVEPHGNVDHVVGSQEVQTQDLIYYHPARDREQHSAWELFSYREDSNEAAFAVAIVEKIYAHESLTFNNTVACEVISKWKAGLKDDMDARSDVYVLSNGCKKCSDDSDGYYWEYTPGKGNVLGMKIVRDQSGNTLRVSQSRFYNEKLVQTLLEGHSILSLEGSLSGDCDVEKNGKWSCIYVVGSQKYHMVCTRLDIASSDVEAMMLQMMALSPTEAGYMTLTEAAKEAIWLKGLPIESGFELKIVAGIAIGALSKAVPISRFQAQFDVEGGENQYANKILRYTILTHKEFIHKFSYGNVDELFDLPKAHPQHPNVRVEIMDSSSRYDNVHYLTSLYVYVISV